jgi:hypothetical protein
LVRVHLSRRQPLYAQCQFDVALAGGGFSVNFHGQDYLFYDIIKNGLD